MTIAALDAVGVAKFQLNRSSRTRVTITSLVQHVEVLASVVIATTCVIMTCGGLREGVDRA